MLSLNEQSNKIVCLLITLRYLQSSGGETQRDVVYPMFFIVFFNAFSLIISIGTERD